MQVPPRMLSELDALAMLREQTRAELIRSILRTYLDERKKHGVQLDLLSNGGQEGPMSGV
jgi:metal-responsive CopG/Arc/MetJ family transcriptional regulator